MSLKKSFAKSLRRMLEGETLNASEIQDQTTLQCFVQDGVVKQVPSKGKRYVYRINDPELLENYLSTNYQIKSLSEYLSLKSKNESSGTDSLKATFHTKEKRTVAMLGFFLKSIHPLSVKLYGKTIDFPLPQGMEGFISDPVHLSLSEQITIVGIENPEVFRKIDRLSSYFAEYEPCLFVLRYMSKGLPDWLSHIPNHYLHFGDFDLSGLQIYVSEYKSKLKASRCNFFIPPNIEQLISKYGNRDLYEKQRNHTQNLKITDHPEIEQLGKLINRYGKGLEQEILFEI
jgi:hypothetical protein